MPSPEYFVDLARKITEAKHGAKGAIIADAIRACGNRSAVYRGLQEFAGWQSGRKTRADTGESKVDAEAALKIAGYIHTMNRKNGKQIVFLEDAMADLVANGILDGGASLSTVRRALEKHGISPRQMRNPAPVQQLRSEHPNHVHQVDPSVCTMYYLGKNAKFEWQGEGEFYKNKPENVEKARAGMLWRYVLTDHASGYIEPFYIQAAGESFVNYFDALMYFWGRKSHTPFHGVPRYLVSDRIGAMKTSEIQHLLAALEIEHIVAQQARAKGQVENANNIIETHFEYRLRGLVVRDVAHLNQLASEWARGWNTQRRHSRHGMTRTECWLKHVKQEHIRLLPAVEICKLLAEPKAHVRTVSPDMSVTFAWPGEGSKTYRVRHIAGLNVKDKVRVQPAPFALDKSIWVTVTAIDGTEARHLVTPIERDSFGFDVKAALIGDEHIRVAADTPREIARKEMQKAAYNTDKLSEAEKAAKQNQPVFQGQIDTMKALRDVPKIEHLPRRGVDIKPALELPKLSPMQSLMALSRALDRPLTAAEGEDLRRQYPSGCTDADIEGMAARLRVAGVRLRAVK